MSKCISYIVKYNESESDIQNTHLLYKNTKKYPKYFRTIQIFKNNKSNQHKRLFCILYKFHNSYFVILNFLFMSLYYLYLYKFCICVYLVYFVFVYLYIILFICPFVSFLFHCGSIRVSFDAISLSSVLE